MRRIAFINEKGGTCKTTLCVNVAARLAARGLRVLVADMDTQGHAGKSLGVDVRRLSPTIHDWLVDPGARFEDVVRPTPVAGIDLLPANKDLAAFPVAMAAAPDRAARLRTRLDALGSIFIGVVLIIVAAFIVVRIRALLIGKSAEPALRQQIDDLINRDPAIETLLNTITLQFGPKVVLDGIRLDVFAGETLVILGGSGSGKTVLMKHDIGLLQPARDLAVIHRPRSHLQPPRVPEVDALDAALRKVGMHGVSPHQRLPQPRLLEPAAVGVEQQPALHRIELGVRQRPTAPHPEPAPGLSHRRPGRRLAVAQSRQPAILGTVRQPHLVHQLQPQPVPGFLPAAIRNSQHERKQREQ